MTPPSNAHDRRRAQAAQDIKRIVETEVTEVVHNLPSGMTKITVTVTKATDFTDGPMQLQERHRFIYTIVAVSSGLFLLVFLLIVSLFFPNPTLYQLRLWLAVMALAAAGFATTITGLLNVNAKFGTQLVVGATGAFGVLVLFYLVNPAVLR